MVKVEPLMIFRASLSIFISLVFSGFLTLANSDDSRNSFAKQNCSPLLTKQLNQVSELRKAIPKASHVIESYCINFLNKSKGGGQILVLYLYRTNDNEPTSALVLFEKNKQKIKPLISTVGLGHEVFPFYIKEAKNLKSHFLFSFDFDSDGKSEIFFNTAAGMNGKDLQVYEVNRKSFKRLSFSQINNKVSQANVEFISSPVEKEIVLNFLPKSSALNPAFEVYFQDSENLSVKKLQNPMRYIKTKEQ
jgi:hypothetical protein